MIWLYIGFIVFIVISISVFLDGWWYDFWEKLFFSFIALLCSALISLLLLIVSSVIVSCNANFDYNMESDTKIIALKDNPSTNGSFYIMGGYVSEDLYYYYAKETEFGYKTEKIMADNAYIKYTNDEAHIEKYSGEFSNNRLNFWAIPMCDDRYIIYCPEGTVKNEFNVDLE